MSKFYTRKIWQKARKVILSKEPFCRMCRERGVLTIATDVDHIIPLKVDQSLALAEDNLQPLCKACHNAKTKEDEKKYFLEEKSLQKREVKFNEVIKSFVGKGG